MKIIFLILSLITISAMADNATSTKNIEDGWNLFDDISTPEVQWVISPLALEKRLESATNPVLETREPVNFALGLRKFRHLLSIEYSRFSESSGNETYHVNRELQDLLGWYRYAFYKNRKWSGSFGGGLGVYQEQVTTSFYNLTQDFGSGNKWTAAAGLGLEYELIKYLTLFVEARLISGQNLDPNPNPDFLARMSVQF